MTRKTGFVVGLMAAAGLMAGAREFNAEILRYLNRLSDLCWLLARYAEHLHDEAQTSGEKR